MGSHSLSTFFRNRCPFTIADGVTAKAADYFRRRMSAPIAITLALTAFPLALTVLSIALTAFPLVITALPLALTALYFTITALTLTITAISARIPGRRSEVL